MPYLIRSFLHIKETAVYIMVLLEFCFIDSFDLNKLSFMHLFFLKPFCCMLNMAFCSAQVLILIVTSFSWIFSDTLS